MERDLRGELEEQEEKAMLSLSCIYFLKVASENPIVRVYMVDQNALGSMKKSLYFEELQMKFYPIPMDIENTFIGRNMEYLFRCMTGHESLDPRSIVSYRIVSRIADLLTGVEDTRYETLQGESAMDKLRELVAEEWKKKLQRETSNWEHLEKEISKENMRRKKRFNK